MKRYRPWFRLVFYLVLCALQGCATGPSPYIGTHPSNPQFERGMPFAPLDLLGDTLSKLPQLLFWNRHYGNHSISAATEEALAAFLSEYDLKHVKVRINQWAPWKEVGRLVINPDVAWPYKILFFPSTLITSTLGRPFGGLLVSDYFDPGSNTINIFSDSIPIVLHEGGHALDFSRKVHKGTYSIGRMLPGVDLFQESVATEEAMLYLENNQQYQELIDAYKILYPAYATYLISYVASSPPAYVGAVLAGHWAGRFKAREKEWQLKTEGKWIQPGQVRRGRVHAGKRKK